MKRCLNLFCVASLCLILSACGIASYSRVGACVVDGVSRQSIEGAKLRVVYTKPMMDMTYQRRDRATTAADGCATLLIATNHSQFFILGRTRGIFPAIVVAAEGYPTQSFQLWMTDLQKVNPVLLELHKPK